MFGFSKELVRESFGILMANVLFLLIGGGMLILLIGGGVLTGCTTTKVEKEVYYWTDGGDTFERMAKIDSLLEKSSSSEKSNSPEKSSSPGKSRSPEKSGLPGKVGMREAKYVVLCVGLGEEGLHEKGERALLSYRENMPRIVERLQNAGKTVVVANSYPSDNFNEVDYADLRDINLEVQQWPLPTINWAEGATEAAIPPSLFEALEDGKSLPEYLPTQGDQNGVNTVRWVAEKGLESYTISFESRDTTYTTVYWSEKGRVVAYRNGVECRNEHDGNRGELAAGTGLEQAGDTFTVRGENLHQIRFYRAAMTEQEVQAIAKGAMLRSSLELYCPLREGDATNYAQTKNTISTMEMQ